MNAESIGITNPVNRKLQEEQELTAAAIDPSKRVKKPKVNKHATCASKNNAQIMFEDYFIYMSISSVQACSIKLKFSQSEFHGDVVKEELERKR